MRDEDYFSSTYAQARSRFLQAAADAGLAVEHRLHPEKGRDGEELAMDVVRDGPADAQALLILTSACHGVEGFCGTGIQLAALSDAAWRRHAADRGVAVLYIHGLNPYGFSHLRRTTHENIDLNRNFQDFSRPLPVNAPYRDLHAVILPAEWPPGESNQALLGAYIARNGEAAYQSAITQGQHEFEEGMFFGGTAPSWSNTNLREVLRRHGGQASRIAWIDIHTGLGPSGVGERIHAGRNDDSVVRARAWWDGGGATPVTSIYDGSSTSAFLTGLMCNAVYEECPQAQYTGIALEYGTVPVLETLQALRAEHWLDRHPQPPGSALASGIKQQMKGAFYIDTPEWKSAVLAQARQALVQGADGLAG
ncbi:M14 family metallopeptidase [Caenimonas aquaedulcis]|uniref:M14 family metallopeptidase n=1 Tax=Caenimonas aquaedulcis TaxID=2793270 RepID=A0A931H7D5_9BURK|nr:M14 family metallopeptidase [Caenimonas aquaedulcis]MBG9389753.1 M14 family metallopeptidase [Caenimonas aquaedulcis]